MKKLLFALVSVSMVASLSAQVISLYESTTRAVVVGISDYQSLQIQDLQFADRDAVAFADWLKSPAGGSVPEDNIQMLTEAKATTGRITDALYWLLDESKPGDLAIFYFSGHGDVEAKIRSQLGFLLAADSPPTNYIGNAVNLRDVQDIVSTMSIENKVRVVLVTDACHSGKLAGSSVGGTQATAQALKDQFVNELKIMSCQPDELSLEGEQWGGGRGVFSYHLLEGLTGLADKSKDGTVNLFEIGRYLEDKVPEETEHAQMPFTSGDHKATISLVDATSLAQLIERKKLEAPDMNFAQGKGIEEAVLAKADSLSRALYAEFKMALDSGYLMEAGAAARSADELYLALIERQALQPLHSLMRRNFAVALQDEVQQALNALLDNDPYEADNWKSNPAKYLEYPKYLQRAMDLLGEKHFMYRSLLAKKLYFEGYNLVRNIADFEKQPARRDSLKAAAKAKYLESLAIEPEAAYPCYAVGTLYFQNVPIQADSLLLWMQKAVDRSPSWLLPYLDAASEIMDDFNDVPRAEPWLLKAKTFHPESYLLLIRLAWLNQWKNEPETANAICRELIARKPDLPEAWATLAHTQFVMQNDWEEVEKLWMEALKLNWRIANPVGGFHLLVLMQTNPDSLVRFCEKRIRADSSTSEDWAWLLVPALIKLRRFEEAGTLIQKWQRVEYGYVEARMFFQAQIGHILLLQGRLVEAESELKKSFDMAEGTIHRQFIISYSLLGVVKDRQEKPSEAEDFFKKAVDYPFCWDQNVYKNDAYFLYGRFLLHQNRLAEAQIQFENAQKISPKTWHYPLGMALLAAKNGQETAALDWLEKALNSFYFDKWAIDEEPLFKKIRKNQRFKAMMKKYFPNPAKN